MQVPLRHGVTHGIVFERAVGLVELIPLKVELQYLIAVVRDVEYRLPREIFPHDIVGNDLYLDTLILHIGDILILGGISGVSGQIRRKKHIGGAFVVIIYRQFQPFFESGEIDTQVIGDGFLPIEVYVARLRHSEELFVTVRRRGVQYVDGLCTIVAVVGVLAGPSYRSAHFQLVDPRGVVGDEIFFGESPCGRYGGNVDEPVQTVISGRAVEPVRNAEKITAHQLIVYAGKSRKQSPSVFSGCRYAGGLCRPDTFDVFAEKIGSVDRVVVFMPYLIALA